MPDLSASPVQRPGEDALAFLMRAGHSTSTLGDDPRGPEVLEIALVWGDTILDVRHSRAGGAPITVGSRTGHRWRLLGAPVAWVPPTFARLAWLAAPTLSEVREEGRADLYAPVGESIPLLAWEDGETLVLRHRPEWEGFVDADGARHAISSLPGHLEPETGLRCVPLPGGGRLVLDLGEDLVVFAHRVRPGRRVLVPLADHIDYPFLGVMALMGFAFAMLSALIALTPAPHAEALIEVPERISSLVLQVPVPEEPPPSITQGKKVSNQEEGARAAGPEGRKGKRDARQKEAKGSPDELRRRTHNQEVALSAGVLGVFSESGALSGVLGSSALDSDLTRGIGGLTGAVGTQLGTGGLGDRGDDFGGGGTVDGGFGPGTRGRAGGDGRYGAVGGSPPRPEGKIDVPTDPITMGGMDKRLVDEVVRRHLSQIRHCYQRVLPQQPDLAGQVSIRFIIARDGSVSSAAVKSSSLGSAQVETCITQRFMKMTFPEPRGGGIVIVVYPFMFAPG